MRFLLVEDKQITISDKDYGNVKKFLDQNNIKYNNKDISYDRNEISDNRTYSLRDGKRVLKILSKKNPNITSQYLNVLRSITPNHSHYKNYMNYLNNLKVKLNGQETIETIFKLILNDKLTGQEKWLNEPSLYSEGDPQNAFKIKTLAFIKDPDTKTKYSRTPPTVAFFTNNGKFINSEQFQQKLLQWEDRSNRQNEKDKIKQDSSSTPEEGADILKRALKVQDLNVEDVRTYVNKHVLKDQAGWAMTAKSIIEAGGLDDQLDQILGKKYSSKIGRSKLELINKAIINAAYDAVNDTFNKNKKGN